MERTSDDVMKIAKRITMLMRELETHSLDMALYSKALAEGKFPRTHLMQVGNALTSASSELTRIQNSWFALFKEELNVNT